MLLVILTTGAPTSGAALDACFEVNCGFRCTVYGNLAGYCNAVPEYTTGCVQLVGPDCMSIQNARCCTGEGGGAF
jgi:hypothetical protein